MVMTLPATSVIQATQAASAKMADRHTPFVFDEWYVAAFADEVGQQLLARTLLGRGVVMFRDSQGKVVAMEDRCPHRSMPLRAARQSDDEVYARPTLFGLSRRCDRLGVARRGVGKHPRR
jgi:vanillate O-demethylase monooxygenase subunit